MDFSGPIQSIAWSKGGEYLVVGVQGYEIAYVAEITNTKFGIVAELGITAPTCCIGWALTDQMIAFGSSNGLLTVLDSTQRPPSSWSVVFEEKITSSAINSIDWSKNGKYLAIGDDDNGCEIFDAKSLREDNFLKSMTNLSRNSPVLCVSFGAGGNFLAVGSADGKAAIYRAKGVFHLLNEINMDCQVSVCKWSHDGRYIALSERSEGSLGPYAVFDTIAWERLDLSEEHFTDSLNTDNENCTSLDWSNDGRWLVIGGSAGNTRVIDVDEMEVAYLIERGDVSEGESERSENIMISNNDDYDLDEHDHEEEDPRLSDSPAQLNEGSLRYFDSPTNPQPDGNASIANASDATSILEDLASTCTPGKPRKKKSSSPKALHIVKRWTHRDEPRHFLETVDEFLSPYEYDDPPEILRVFVACALMLQWHMKWLDSHAMIVDVLSMQEDGKPMETICYILQNTIRLMQQIMRREKDIYQWWNSVEKYNLTNKDIKQVSNWNSWWEQVDVDASLIDSNLLLRVDKKHLSSTAEEEREENYVYDQSEHVNLPTSGRRSNDGLSKPSRGTRFPQATIENKRNYNGIVSR